MRIRLVFPAIEHHETGITPTESPIRFVAHIIEKAAQPDGIGIADFMISTQIEHRHIACSHRLIQFRQETGGLLVIGRVVDTIAVEDNKIIIDILHLPEQSLQGFRTLVQVIENDSGKVRIT